MDLSPENPTPCSGHTQSLFPHHSTQCTRLELLVERLSLQRGGKLLEGSRVRSRSPALEKARSVTGQRSATKYPDGLCPSPDQAGPGPVFYMHDFYLLEHLRVQALPTTTLPFRDRDRLTRGAQRLGGRARMGGQAALTQTQRCGSFREAPVPSSWLGSGLRGLPSVTPEPPLLIATPQNPTPHAHKLGTNSRQRCQRGGTIIRALPGSPGPARPTLASDGDPQPRPPAHQTSTPVLPPAKALDRPAASWRVP